MRFPTLFVSLGLVSLPLASCGAPKAQEAPHIPPIASSAPSASASTTIADEPLLPEEAPARVKTIDEKGEGIVTGWERKDGEDYFCVDTKPSGGLGPSTYGSWGAWRHEGTLSATAEGAPVAILHGPPVGGRKTGKQKGMRVPCTFLVRTRAGSAARLIIHRAFLVPDENTLSRFEIGVNLERKLPQPVALEWKTQWLESGELGGGFNRFAEGRLNPTGVSRRSEDGPLSFRSALEWMSPADVVNDALEMDRARFASAKEAESIPIASIKGPSLETYPWSKLVASLSVSAPAEEPLAAFAPADFYYLRFATLPKLLEAMETFEKRFAAPLYGDMMLFGRDAAPVERDLSARYHAELGLRTGPLTKSLGASVVGEVAIVGSDPYVVEGSDLSLVFRVKNKLAFELALKESLASFAEKHGVIESVQGNDGGAMFTSKDGQVHSVRGWLKDDVYVVSNSPAAFSRIAQVAKGSAPSLAREPDFGYILARDTATKSQNSEIFAFLGEAFVRSVTGPKQKIAEVRRAIALMELRAPGYAELLFRRYLGRAPANLQELRDTKMLRKEDLVHREGATIQYDLGNVASSKWGTLAHPKALLDLPEITKLTKSEADAYAHFRDNYNESYARYVDPISMRASFSLESGKPFFDYDVRVLPPSKERLGKEERMWIREFGLGRIQMPRQDGGLHMAVGIGKGSQLRKELESFGGDVPMLGKVQVDWIGNVATFGLFETNTLPNVLSRVTKRGNGLGTMGTLSQLTKLPLYFSLEVSSPLTLGVILSRAKKELTESGGAGILWESAFTHHEAKVVRIGEKRAGDRSAEEGEGLQAFYAVHKNQLVLTFREDVMRRVIEKIDRGELATHAEETPLGAGSTNLGMQASLQPSGPFSKAMELSLRNGDSSYGRTAYSMGEVIAESIFLAYPETQQNPSLFEDTAKRIFGGVPTAGSRGSRYTFGSDGIVDPVLGSRIDPKRIGPVPPSGLRSLLSALSRFDAMLSFDNEASDAIQSLHFRGRVELHR